MPESERMPESLDLAAVRSAAERIRGRVLRTPTLVRVRPGAELFLKAESLQATGAFKLRGAFSMMTTLPEGTGVVAHSSGNHAQAVARAAAELGLAAVVVMPCDAPRRKRAAAEAAGAEVVEVGSDSDERASVAAEIARDRGWTEVPPFDHPLVAAGQGTAALELVEDAPDLERFYAPISGGGLMAGCAVVLRALVPGCEIVGVEPEDAGDAKLSLAAGQRCKVPPPRTIADGLRVRTPGAFTFSILQSHVARVELVTDDELLDAMAWALGELHLALEPSGAASLAVALREARGRCGVLLSGGNAAPELLAEAARRAAAG
jgi:threonine dehydratase